jgi:hypothetical protein
MSRAQRRNGWRVAALAAVACVWAAAAQAAPTVNGRIVCGKSANTTPQYRLNTASTSGFGAETATVVGATTTFVVDRAAANLLDANGAIQPSDGNITNDLKLDAGVVRCTTCHSVHSTDSNSLTVDPQ